MKKIVKEFLGNLKPYFNYIMTLGFKKLGVHFICLVLISLFALLVYLPIGLINDFIVTLLGSLIGNVPNIIYGILEVITELASLVCSFLFFMYMFNQRYKDVYKDEILNAGKEVKNDKVNPGDLNKKIEPKIELPELDLPKKK